MDRKRDDVEMSSTAEYTLSQACRFRAERDAARQRLQGLEEWTEDLEDSYRTAWNQLLETSAKEKRLGRLVWRLQNRLARAHRREKALRKGMRMWREKAISGPVHTVSAYDLLSDGEREVLRIWPRFEETGEPVLFENSFLDHHGDVRSVLSFEMWQEGGFTLHTGQGMGDWHSAGERVKRPAVLAADGETLEVGQTVWNINNGMEFTVSRLPKPGEYQAVEVRYRNGSSTSFDPDQLTHQRPVLDADGVPIKVGDRVWHVSGGGPYEITRVNAENAEYTYNDNCGPMDWGASSKELTHKDPRAKPEPPDSWERIEEDLGDEMAKQQCGPISPELACKLAGEFVRRCQALAERGE